MKFSSAEVPECEPDMTPMIDVTFQLIIFFMLTMNFSQEEQIELIRLPSSELAKPADVKPEAPLTVQLSKFDMGDEKKDRQEGRSENEKRVVLFGGSWYTVGGRDLDNALLRETQVLERNKSTAAKATIIIRADKEAWTGKVQGLIKACQARGFEKFVLRAKQEQSGY